MLTLIATCLLAAGTTFTPVPDWTITEIVGGGRGTLFTIPSIACLDRQGNMIPCPEPDTRPRITMQRTLAPGQVAEPPQGCVLKVEMKEQ